MYAYVDSLHKCYLFCLQTRAESLRHHDWDKVVYFVCSSLDSNELAAGSNWSTQEELRKEAELEVAVMVQLVQKYICKQSKLEPEPKTSLNVNPTSEGKVDPNSVCVMFPTRFTVSTKGRIALSSVCVTIGCGIRY